MQLQLCVLENSSAQNSQRRKKLYGKSVTKGLLLSLIHIYKNEGLAGLMINPWGDAFFLSKPMIRMILDQKKATVGKENAVTIQRCDITELECDCIVNAQ